MLFITVVDSVLIVSHKLYFLVLFYMFLAFSSPRYVITQFPFFVYIFIVK
jgi:hypothetical protein